MSGLLQLLQQLWSAFGGKRTYAAAAAFLVLALVALANGDYQAAAGYVSAAVAAAGLRSAVGEMMPRLRKVLDEIDPESPTPKPDVLPFPPDSYRGT